MKTVVYRTRVDPDVDYPADKFAREVAIYLADPEGWAQFFAFVLGPRGKTIRLSSPSSIKASGCKEAGMSCATLGGTDIWLSADRWMRGAPASRLPLERYRQYMVSHEMGHSLGYDHVKCPGSGPVPVMVQQTLGIGACTPNTKLTEIYLNAKLRLSTSCVPWKVGAGFASFPITGSWSRLCGQDPAIGVSYTDLNSELTNTIWFGSISLDPTEPSFGHP